MYQMKNSVFVKQVILVVLDINLNYLIIKEIKMMHEIRYIRGSVF